MKSDLKIVLLDINGEYDDEVNLDLDDEDRAKNITKLESPIRIMNEFCCLNIFENLQKTENELKQLVYTFTYPFKDNNDLPCEIYIIDDLSVTYNINLIADAYIVFCDLEKKSTSAKLEKIINYIKDSCSVDVKTFIIGLFQNRPWDDYNEENMQLFLDSNQFLYEYFQIFAGEKSNEKINNNNVIGEEENKDNINDKDLGEIKKILEDILINVRDNKNNTSPKIIKRGASKKDGNIARSGGKCLLF